MFPITVHLSGPIHVHVHDSEALAVVQQKLDQLLTIGASLMALSTETKAALAKVNETTNEIATIVEEVVTLERAEDEAFLAEIADLKQQIADGKAVTEADLTELTAGLGVGQTRLDAIKEALLAIGRVPDNPTPPVVIPPEPPPAPPVEG